MADVAPLLFGRALQKGEEKSPKRLALGEAVAQRMIANETLAYFIGRTYLFMVLNLLPCSMCVLLDFVRGFSLASVPPMLLLFPGLHCWPVYVAHAHGGEHHVRYRIPACY